MRRGLAGLVFVGLCLLGGGVRGATIDAASCSQAHVQAAIDSAAIGDTVRVPSGECTWTSMVGIERAISLIGAVVGQTVIISQVPANAYNFTLGYRPADPSANALMRISGFTFDLGGGARSGIILSTGRTLVLQTKVRIDHNRFQNIAQGTTQYMFLNPGNVRGVVDHNDFGPATYFARTNGDGLPDWGKGLWENHEGVVFGKKDNNMWFEDNVIRVQSGGGAIDCSQGMRWAFRYNTINTNSGQMFDQHGNYGSTYSCFGGELYGNNVLGTLSGQFLDQRGGRFFVFNNNFPRPGWNINVREEADDATTPVNNPSAYPQHVNGTYVWGNRDNLSGGLVNTVKGVNCVGSVCFNTPMPVPGQNFFTESTSPGITCGTRANRPSTCIANQGYWATDQSCTNLSGLVGDIATNPSRGVISGTLYRCTAVGSWDAGASPLAYPHALISGSSGQTSAPSAPTSLRIMP